MRKVKDVPKTHRRGPETPNASRRSRHDQVQFALTWLKRHSTKATLTEMVRYSIPADHAYGVAMKDIKALGTMLGRNQPLAVALWATRRVRSSDAPGKVGRQGCAPGTHESCPDDASRVSSSRAVY